MAQGQELDDQLRCCEAFPAFAGTTSISADVAARLDDGAQSVAIEQKSINDEWKRLDIEQKSINDESKRLDRDPKRLAVDPKRLAIESKRLALEWK